MTTEPVAHLDLARQEVGISHADLWLRYFSLGGRSGPEALKASLLGASFPSAYDHKILVHALNERFSELGRNHPLAYPGDGPSGSGAPS